jgi:hypothetical protein
VVVLGVLGVLALLLTAYCLLDVVTSPAPAVQGVPKPLWAVAVVLLPVVGPVLWLAVGRPEPGTGRTGPRLLPERGGAGRAPDDDEAFLRELRRRAEEQRRRAREQQRRDEDGRTA